MKAESSPLVSVLIPVYNGAVYLPECIESVLAQTYSKWECTIVNNCSTDESGAIALKYAARDSRIRAVNTDRFLRIMENHNHTIRQLALTSKYCKFVFADDWLYPTCIEEMVRVAERHPSVGLVGAYTTDGRAVLWQGPAYPSYRVAGREVCRNMLLGGEHVLGTMTSLLVRSELIRKRQTFFDDRNLHSDTAACFDILQESDYGFIHQVLSFSRPPEGSARSFAKDFDTTILGEVLVLLKYGRVFLSEAEYEVQWKKLKRKYHRTLANNALRLRSSQFWKYHEDTLTAFGSGIDRRLLAMLLFAEIGRCLLHPFNSGAKGLPWWSRALSRFSSGNRDVEAERVP